MIGNEAKYYELDGKTAGIIIKIGEDYYKDGKGNLYLFKSLDLAKTYLARDKKIYNPKDYKIYILIKENDNEEILDYNNMIDYEGIYYYITENAKSYFISPIIKNEISRIGYFVFEDGDKILSDKEYGKKRNKEIYNYIVKALSDMVLNSYLPMSKPSIEYISKDENGHLFAKMKNSTVKIHICLNNQIMDLNQYRKDNNIRCLPYDKNMDKYLSIYTYITKDMAEPKKFKSEIYGQSIQDDLITYINNYYPESEPRYIGIQFNGKITLEE